MSKYEFNIKKIKEEKKLGFLYHEIFKKTAEFSRKYPKLTFTILPLPSNLTPERAFALGALYMAIFILGNNKKELSDKEVKELEKFLMSMEINVSLYELVERGDLEILVKDANFAFVISEKGKKTVEDLTKTDEGALQLFQFLYNEMFEKLKDGNLAFLRVAEIMRDRYGINIVRILVRNKDKVKGLIIRDDLEGFEDFAKMFDVNEKGGD